MAISELSGCLGTASAENFHGAEIISGHWMGHEEAKEGTLPAKKLFAFCKDNFSVVLGFNLIVLNTITICVIVRIVKRKNNEELANVVSVIFSVLLDPALTVIHTIITCVKYDERT